jgi:MSHA biogenesis protein MshI
MECRVFGLFPGRSAAKSRIGICIEGERIALALVSRASARPTLKRCEIITVDPRGGPEAVTAALRGAGLPRAPVSVVLRPEDYQLALVEAPDVAPDELRAAMRWRLKDAIEFRVEDAVIDVFDVPSQNRGSQGRMMYAVAARREAVERCGAAVASLPGFDVVDVPELCLRNIAASLPEAAGGVALLHLGATSATVILVRGTTFYFARQMDLHSLPRAAGAGGATAVTGAGAARGAAAVQGAATAGKDTAALDTEAIVLELQRSLDYYERHFDQPPITRITVSPGGPRSVALAEALNHDTGFEVTALDLNALIESETAVAPETQTACLLAVGAAMREERRTL